MERNGDVLTDFNYCPGRFRLDTNDLLDSKMCKDDINESLFCDVPKSMKKDVILSTDTVGSGLKTQFVDLLTSTQNFLDSDELKWNSDSYNFSSSKKMPLISKDSFINGKLVLAASNSSFQIENCFSAKSGIASESSLDTNSDSLHQTFDEENSSSSIEEIFCPISSNPTEVKSKYVSRVELSQKVSENKTNQNLSVEPTNFSSPQKETNLCLKERGELLGQKKDRVMPELVPTLICLDDDDEEEEEAENDEEDSVLSRKESPPAANIAGSPEMPKLIPFSVESDELLRIKAGHLNDSKSAKCPSVDLQSCTRKLFPDADVVNFEHFKSKHAKQLSPLLKDNVEEVGFSFSSSFISPKQETRKLNCGIDLSQKRTKKLQSKSISKSKSLDGEIPEIVKDSKRETKSKNSDSIKFSNKAKKKGGQLNIDKKIDYAKESVSSIRQPKVLLRRISLDQVSGHGIKNLSSNGKSEKITFENCLPSKDSNDNYLTSQPVRDDNSSNEAPEIEEIEGVRFFQFRSKHDMEEFNRKPMVGEDEMELIVPTKTTDITLIKGWRNKYFASDSQLPYVQSDDGNSQDESSQNAKSVPMLAGSNESKFLDFRNCLKDNKTKLLDVEIPVDSSPVVPQKEQLKAETKELKPETKELKPESKELKPETKELKPETKETVKYEKPSNAMSAFVSKDLDNFLKNSATLNIRLLQKVNPNITPIPPGHGILSLGKLGQPDYQLNTLAALKKRNFLNKLKEDQKPQVPAIYSSDSDDAVVVLSSSEESSTEDDVPVASLNSGRKRMATSNSDTVSPINSMKRRKSDASIDGASQRVVLRLTKGNQGPSDNYKVFGVSSEKHDSEYSPTSSSSSSSSESSTSSSEDSDVEELPDEFKTGADGGLSLIKETIFLKESEPKLLEEFLNNLNVLGTNKDVTMLVQSNQAYFRRGPVLQTETCADALDALLTNKEFTDLKNKHTPKKKLKAWQKYLPKNVTKAQKQKCTIVPHVSKQLADMDKNPPKSETCEKSESIKDEKLTSSKQRIKLKKCKLKKKITEIEKPKPGDVKSQVPVSEEVPKVRKRRSRSAIDLCDPLLLLERGKRSIRLPARYLDSAVLAAGSEWVSPIFVEEDKKTRKQLLDVLDKITPNKESSEELKKVIARKEEPSVSEEQIVKKTVDDNIQPNKAIKRQIKTANPVKKIKIDEVTKCLTIEESDSSKNQSGHVDKKEPNLPEVFSYLMPSCPCWPCSRTMSYKKSSKEFLCFSHNPVLEKQNNSKFILESKTSQESTLNESIPADIEIIRSTGPKCASQNKEKVSSVENKVSGESETVQQNKTLSILSESPSVVVDEKILTSKEVVQDISKKLLFVLPVNKGTISNSLHSISQPILRTKDHQISAQKALQLASEMRGKPPILTRKPIPENSSPSTPNIAPTSSPFLPPSPVATSTSVVFKLPPLFDNRFVKLAPKPLSQASASSEKQLPNINAKVGDNQVLSTPQQSSLPSQNPSKPVMKGFKIGNVNFYLEQGHENNSSHPVLKYLANKLPPALLSTGISNGSDNSPVSVSKSPTRSEKEDSSSLNKVDEALTPPKVSLDLHNYNKKLERRRKSPLSQRVFNESPESKKILGQLSDSDVDVDTVDEKFNPKLVLKQQQLANSSGSDASDIECDEIFSSNIHNVIYNGLKKSIKERKRRLYIKKSFEKLKGTSPFFNDAKSCADILSKATFAVQKLRTKEVFLRQAKRILRLQNGRLLEKLARQLKDIKETETRDLLKRHIITVMANDWTKHSKRNDSTLTKPKRKVVKTSLKTDKDVAASANGTESQIEAPSKQLELDETPKMGLHESSISFEMASKETEEPVVQLRILELPSSETDKDFLSFLDSQIEVQMEETIPPQTQELDLSQPSREKKKLVPEALGGNNSDDDDLLVIDLEGYAAENVSPKKDATISQDTKAVDSPSVMENFPGLVPIYPSNFYEEGNPFALDLSKFSTEASTSFSPMSIDSSCEYLEKSLHSKPSGPNVSPRNVPHRTTKDVEVLHGVGNSPEDEEVNEVVVPKAPPPKVLEEIVIDDSDDESMDTEQNPNNPGSWSSVQVGTPSTIDNVVIKNDSPIKSSSS